MENDIKSTKTTQTGRIDIPCQYCGMDVKQEHQREPALDRHHIGVGVVHSGHCAHQWRLKIEGQAGFRGRG